MDYVHGDMDERILCLEDIINKAEAERDALREQVRVLREALERFSYERCVFLLPQGCKQKNVTDRCSACHTYAALAATEPKEGGEA